MHTLRFRLGLLLMLLLTGTLLAQGKTKTRRTRRETEKSLKTVPYRNIKQISKNIPTLEVANFLALVGKSIVEGIAVVKGQACPSGHIKGTAMIDGFFAKSSLHDKGVWFNWAWLNGKSKGEIDEEFAGLYLQYTFEGFGSEHTTLAWDTFGNTNGRLVGSPKIIKDTTRLVPPCDVKDEGDENALSLSGDGQYIELPRAVAVQRDFTLDMEIRVGRGGKPSEQEDQ